MFDFVSFMLYRFSTWKTFEIDLSSNSSNSENMM